MPHVNTMEIQSTVMIQIVLGKWFDPLVVGDATRYGTIPAHENLKYLLAKSLC